MTFRKSLSDWVFFLVFKRRLKSWTPWPCLPGKGDSIGPNVLRLVSDPLPVACGRALVHREAVRPNQALLRASYVLFALQGFPPSPAMASQLYFAFSFLAEESFLSGVLFL